MRNPTRLLPIVLALAVLPSCAPPRSEPAAGPSPLDEVFARPRDFDRVNALFRLILDRVGARFKDLPKMNEQEKVVVLVWHWGEVISKGGFEYFFEQDVDHAAVAKAFETLGVRPASDALRDVLALFPRSQPSADKETRLKQYWQIQQTHKERIERLQKQFWDADREVVKGLADYARQHRQAFEHLCTPPKPERQGT